MFTWIGFEPRYPWLLPSPKPWVLAHNSFYQPLVYPLPLQRRHAAGCSLCLGPTRCSDPLGLLYCSHLGFHPLDVALCWEDCCLACGSLAHTCTSTFYSFSLIPFHNISWPYFLVCLTQKTIFEWCTGVTCRGFGGLFDTWWKYSLHYFYIT